ncbi:hypothetical protein H2O64_04725 [Kordia sp. YSTF-M3]|uniref:Uncharacterized protein n=1 Tax=Kordia aestuariivivens TaxID=2759037 RepID=A0ABR7Q617_9FLAO|nr:hypothetical protein [Kordia aestuariivivens]MBC8753963.1 hypothetical protein [Kordia aestuariivivens]
MIDTLRQNIENALSQVTLQNAPKIFHAIEEEIGYKNIEDRIINMMISESMTASACIVHIENSL